jgi:glycosyltransferase involved in cell wall biosynthesis/uncharacterized membrane protein YciS (DUF1049 family)
MGSRQIQEGVDAREIAVLIPCYNEALTVADVIADFRAQLPHAAIYVFDNNSTDRTPEIAARAGAIVLQERRQGKGFVVQSMFQRVEADIYIMVDGDSTYPASEVHRLLSPIQRGEADMAVGSRLQPHSNSQFRRLNLLGNRFFLFTLNTLFHVHLSDLLSGYRAFSREFVGTIALTGGGFEVETELTIKALEAGFRIAEVSIDLTTRPEGSNSKIRPLRDSLRILATIFALLRDCKPLTFFGSLALASVALGLIPGTMVVLEYFSTGLVPRLPSAVLAVGLILTGMMLLAVGLILHSMTRRIRELEHQIRRMTSGRRRDKMVNVQ